MNNVLLRIMIVTVTIIMKYKAFERNNGKIKYPINSDDITPPIVDRCKNLFTSNNQIVSSSDENVRKIKSNGTIRSILLFTKMSK